MLSWSDHKKKYNSQNQIIKLNRFYSIFKHKVMLVNIESHQTLVNNWSAYHCLKDYSSYLDPRFVAKNSLIIGLVVK